MCIHTQIIGTKPPHKHIGTHTHTHHKSTYIMLYAHTSAPHVNIACIIRRAGMTLSSVSPIQEMSDIREKVQNVYGLVEEKMTQMAVTVHNEGKREGRNEALDEVEQQRLALLQLHTEMVQFMRDTLEWLEKMKHTLTSRLPAASGEASPKNECHPGPFTRQHEPIVFQQSQSITRTSSGQSLTSPKEEAAGIKQPSAESSSTDPVSPTSTCSRDTLFNSADEMKTVPQLNTSSRQGSSQSSSDEERRCRTNGLELHPRKMLASRKKKGKK